MEQLGIKEKRVDAGLTVYALSKMTGIQIRHLRMIEEGSVVPKYDTLRSILDALGYEIVIQKRHG